MLKVFLEDDFFRKSSEVNILV